MLSLHPQHFEDLKKSGLIDETIKRAGIRSLAPAEIRRLLGFEPAGLLSAYLIPYSDGFFRVRCFYHEGKEGAKYLQRKGTHNRLFVPPMLDGKVLADSSIPLVITEGEKKALKAVQEGLPCVGVAGLWCWSDGKSELIKDFDQIEFRGRTVYLVPDNDYLKPNKHGYRKNLKLALERLAFKLAERGADIFCVELPQSEEKIGLDDFLVKFTVEDFHKLPKKRIIPNFESYQRALEILKSGNPLEFVTQELSKNYIGRQRELRLIYLTCLFPKLKENSLVFITGESSIGKSSLVSTLLKGVPDVWKLVLHSSSSKALLYRNKDLTGNVMWIQEFSGANEIVELMKALITERIARHDTVNESNKRGKIYQSFTIRAEGFVCFITSTRETFNEELMNRSFILNLQTNPELLNAITKFHAERAEGRITDKPDYETLQQIFRQVKEYEVVVPYASEIQKKIQKTSPRVVRDFNKILTLIKAHTLLFQYQREKLNNKIVATRDDYQAIHELADLVMDTVSELNSKQIEFLNACKEPVTRADLARLLGKTEKTIKNYIKELRDYLEVNGQGSSQEIRAVYIPTRQVALPEPESISFTFPNFQLPNSPENSKTYIGNSEISDNFQFSKNSTEENENGKNGKNWKNSNFQSNPLIYKEKKQIGKSETENYIYTSNTPRGFDDPYVRQLVKKFSDFVPAETPPLNKFLSFLKFQTQMHLKKLELLPEEEPIEVSWAFEGGA